MSKIWTHFKLYRKKIKNLDLKIQVIKYHLQIPARKKKAKTKKNHGRNLKNRQIQKNKVHDAKTRANPKRKRKRIRKTRRKKSRRRRKKNKKTRKIDLKRKFSISNHHDMIFLILISFLQKNQNGHLVKRLTARKEN